uniref:Uncharacterized protein n=1 Tax=Craspedostauros australis TaxID=1486917 RepID=A0A7R9WTJ0_9STRA
MLQVAPTMSLKSLSLKESYLENIDGSFLSRLQTLNIQNCDITENDAQQLVPFVVSSTALQELHWKDNHFDAANFESIFETALRHNTTLQWVDTYCCIGDDDDDSHGNNNNNNNKSIDANEDEQNNSSCIGRIRHWLWLNRCGRKYIASHTLPIKLWPYLLSRISRLARTAGKPACTSGRECDAIYFLLSNHMELWMYV